ncbi:RNA-binding S4 domain-containing protein [Chitinimonas sp.]|uniref:RNA-binding S4 domain-containing protein n=1 Tax=Chitinimonas sp. TaxID=1934313 RepID=UPI0035B3E46E
MAQQTFTLSSEFIELHNLLKIMSVAASGGEAKNMVANGYVKVDGQMETRKTRKLYAGALVEVFGEEIRVLAAD